MFTKELTFKWHLSRFSRSLLCQVSLVMFPLILAVTTTSFAATNFDGPAELPRVTVPSAMADTPAPGTVISVNAGGDLQSALDSANCGDTIQLQAGATFAG